MRGLALFLWATIALSATAQTVVVDSAGATAAGMQNVRARLNQLRGGRVVQPIVIVVPSRTSSAVGRDGRDGTDGLDGLDGQAGGTLTPFTAPTDAPTNVRLTTPSGRTNTPTPSQPGITAPTLPVPLDPVQQARLDLIPDTVRREVERQIVELGLFRTTSVPFEFNRAQLMPFAEQTLDVVGDVLRRYPALTVEIGGHTDAVGTAVYNQGLSERRAEAVRQYLVERWQIAPERLAAVGYGEEAPVATNANETGRALNRRVEFAVMAR